MRAKAFPLLVLLLAPAAAAQLDLPGKPRPPAEDPAGELRPPAPPRGDVASRERADPLDLPAPLAPGGASAPSAPAGPEDAARFILGELRRSRDRSLADAAVESLLALGPAGLAAARGELASAHGPALLAAARVCLAGGGGAERALVAERLQRALPAEVAAPLLEELLARDPVLASPEYLAGLLEHPTAAMRAAAARGLEARLSPALLPALAQVLTSRKSAARAAALELVARSDDPAARNLLASRLGDPSAQLASRAAALLAGLDEAEPMLLERAFPPGAHDGPLDWERARAYAVLALVEREDTHARDLLDETRIPALLGGLASPQPLVAGACAVALARIGFRALPSHTGPWLEREVPHQLVRSGTGVEFHADFSSLAEPALRALALLSGEAFGDDGEAARRWWLENAQGFRARHAAIEVTEDAPERLLVAFTDAQGESWTLLGPGRPRGEGEGPVLHLDHRAAERVLAGLQAAGACDARRLPSPARLAGQRTLVLSIGEHSKPFALGPPSGSWLEPVLAELARTVDENRWQLLHDPGTPQIEWWRSEHERWEALGPLERLAEEKRLLIAAARRTSGEERGRHLALLERLYRQPGASAAGDFEPLLAVLAGERAYGPRAELLCELLRIAAAGAQDGADSAARERLLELGLARFGPEADGALARVARDLEGAALRALAADARPRARALSCAGLARTGASEDRELLAALLADPEPLVQLAVLACLAESPIEELRETLAERARSAPVELRCAALRALARLGGTGVLDVALEALADGDEAVQRAGVAALAELADPRSASLLASLLVRGPSSPLFADARLGLLRLGPVGSAECLRLLRSGGARARREAALFLAAQGEAQAAGVLLTLLTEDPGDERVAWELAVLSGVDLGAEEHPEGAGWTWWELVVHDDPLAWLLAAAERAGVRAPAREALEGPGTVEGARFLLALVDSGRPQLVERGTRELERLLGVELGRPGAAGRAAWRSEIEESVRARFGE